MRRPALLFVLALVACGGPQTDTTPAPPPDAAAPTFDEAAAAQLAAELLGVLQEMVTIVEARADDCPGMAADLGALFDRAEPVFARARETERHSEHARLLTAAMDDLAPHAQPLGDRISPRLEKCGAEPALVEVMARMPVL